RLDFVLVMGPSRGLRDAIRRTTSAPLRRMTRQGSTQKSHLSASQSAQQCSVCSGMPVHSEQDDCSFACWLRVTNVMGNVEEGVQAAAYRDTEPSQQNRSHHGD